MAFGRQLWRLTRVVTTFVVYMVGMLASASEPSRRAQHKGTGLIGEYNLRTNQLDAGTDPYGWYKEDM